MGEYYNTQQGIPRRSSATPDKVAQRQTEEEEEEILEEGYNPNRLPGSARRYATPAAPQDSIYRIPMSDGTVLRVTERKLATMPTNYQRAAQLETPASRPNRQAHPKRPLQDETVDDRPPAHTPTRGTDALPRQKHRRRLPRFHWLLWVGLAMFSMLVGWYALTALGNWWQTTQDDWQYGRPRTFQIDANVGHGTASHPDSHFIVQNLDRKIIVIEIPGDDPTHARIYIGPTLIGPGEDLTPVTLSFEDVNGDGRLDFVIHVGGSTFIFLNQKDGTFKAAPNQ